MSKVFRLYNGNNNILDWDSSIAYGSNAIGQIEDPNAATVKKEITSIPSPFARIDLVKNAYREVVKSRNLHGKTIFHKMVSDSLDIAQIFYNLPKLTDKIQVVVWEVEKELAQLENSFSPAHKRVSDTLKMYLKQDAISYNFNKMKAIYLLHYKGQFRKTQLDIIGATSPATLFFSSANDLSYLSNDILFGRDKVFDGDFAALDERDEDFILYYFAYKKAYPDFARLFPEVNDYMEFSYRNLNPELKDKIDRITSTTVNDYPDLIIRPNKVEINGITYHHCKENIVFHSDFEISGTTKQYDKMPLVLPIESGAVYSDLFYVSDKWGNNCAPCIDKNPIEQRKLPKSNETYPYITISDLLEETLVRVEKNNNTKDGFYVDFVDNDENYTYLLPLKETFFKYFDVNSLMTSKVCGMKMFEMETSKYTGRVNVTLRIPIQRNKCIEYSRTYIEGAEVDVNKNKGCLITKEFSIGMLSNVSFNDDKQAYYRVGLMTAYDEASEYNLDLYKSDKKLSIDYPIIRNIDNENIQACKTFVVEQKTFDHMRISSHDASGIILPKFIKNGGTDIFTFAIDLGTTNLHVEYTVNNQAAKPFDMNEPMLKLWGNIDNRSSYVFAFDMIPSSIGKDSLYKFPMRTALSESISTNWNMPVFSFANTNIPFAYEKKSGYSYNRVITNLKWSNDLDNTKKIRSFIDNLFYLLRTKVLQCRGNLQETKIVWFYPISMVLNRYNTFESEWNAAYEKYFGGSQQNIIPMTESVAPYEYYRSQKASVNNIVTVDIGGGTTDMVIANSGKVDNITSFRFAANSIFGNVYTSNRASTEMNKLLAKYESKILDILSQNSLQDLVNIYNQHKNRGNSADIASFFFSLKNNKDVVEKHLSDNLDFNKMLQIDDNYKIVFVIFYCAIIYHLARIMKGLGKEMPRHIAFSGNGSKVIRVISNNINTLEDFTKVILEKVYQSEYHKDGLSILHDEDIPKEVTCKGGLSNPECQTYNDISKSKIVMRHDGKFITSEKYKDVDNDYIENTVKEVEDFVKFVMEVDEKLSFKRCFGATDDSIKIAKRVCMNDLKTFTTNGLNAKKKEASDSDDIEESLFFYPLNGMLNALISAIYEQTNK